MTAGHPEPVDAGGPPPELEADATDDGALDQESTAGSGSSDRAGEGEPLDGGALHPGLIEAIEGGDDPDEPATGVGTDEGADEAEWAEAVANAVDTGPPPDDVLLALDVPDDDLVAEPSPEAATSS